MTTELDDSFAANIAADFAEEVQAADALLFEIVRANRRPNYSELAYFQKHLNWDETAVRREVRRMGSVVRDGAIAGSPADRQAAAKEAATAVKVLEAEGPKVAEQIAKLEAKLRAMESDAKLSGRRVEDQAAAVQRLRGLCPKHIADGVRVRTGLLSESLGVELQGCKSRIHELESCLDPERHRDEAAHISLLRSSFRDAVDERNSGGFCRYVLSPRWPSIRAELETELAELQAKVGPLQTQYDAELAAIETALDYYSGGPRPA